MKMRTIIAAVAAFTASLALATVTPGVISDDFASSLKYAEANNVPIAVTWGNTSCGYCNTLSETIENSKTLKAWIAEKKIIFVEKHEEYGCKDADYVAAGKWIQSMGRAGGYPYLGLYWKKADGSGTVKEALLARVNQLPVKTPKNNLEAQLVGTLEEYFGDYSGESPSPTPSVSGDASFVTLDVEEDRLEATPDTDTVYVPVVRETATGVAGNRLVVEYLDGSKKTLTVSWKVGVTNQYIAVEMPETFIAGKQIRLTLTDASGTAIDTSRITMVKAYANSPTNPHWIGEYDPDDLPYGEWTLDYETAKEKLAADGGYIVACFSGVKWCPQCIGIGASLFADKRFYSWAKKNKVILVLFDQPRFNSAEKCQYVGPRLLSYNNDFGKSGASYLSRKGLKGDDPEVLSAINMQWTLTQKWLAPESTAYRLSNPTILLLDSTGTKVAARMNKYETADYTFPTAENLNRLNDLLLLVDADENEGYRTVSPLEVAAGEMAISSLQINDSKKFIAIDGVKAGEYVQIKAESSAKNSQPVTISLYAGDTVIASGTGRLVTDRAVTAEEAAKLSVKLSAFGDSAEYGAKTTFSQLVTVIAGDEQLVKTTEFDSLSKAEQKALNPALYVKRTATLPAIKSVNLGGHALAGTLAVSISAANKITAKLTGERTASFSGTWSEISLQSGMVTSTLVKGSDSLTIAMDANGGLKAVISSTEGKTLSGTAVAGDYAPYTGRYTVTMVDRTGANGTATMTILISKSGKATVSGKMSDGTSISVSSMLALQSDGTATLPIYKSVAAGTLSVALTITPDAADTWGARGDMDTVASLATCIASWDDTNFAVFGGYWESGTTAAQTCEDFGLANRLSVVLSGETNAMVTVVKNNFKPDSKEFLNSLTLTSSTGAFSGKAKVVNSLGKTVNATIKGVLLPGWIDCGGCGDEPSIERPFGSGTLYYNDGGAVVSKPFDLLAEDAE